VPGELSVEKLLRRGEGQHAGLTELLQLERRNLGQRERLREVQLAAVGLERELVETGDVLQKPRRARQPPTVGCARVAGRVAPVVGTDEPGWQLLALERELRLGEPGQRGCLLQEEGVDAAEDTGHPLEQLGVGEPRGEEGRDGLGMVLLELGDALLLLGEDALIACHRHLLTNL
jgi:hypothetical protein